jgi:methylthioribose-1-phosphate isomerase
MRRLPLRPPLFACSASTTAFIVSAMNVTVRGRTRAYRTVTFDPRANAVRLVEQRLLPHEFRIVSTRDFRETAAAIRDMVVRGAGAIGATAAWLRPGSPVVPGPILAAFERHTDLVFRTSPGPAHGRGSGQCDARHPDRPGSGRHGCGAAAVGPRSRQAFAEGGCPAKPRNRATGPAADPRRTAGLTHCNTGWLAFVDIGSATAPLYAAHAEGRRFHVFCDETRPRCQGASLTAWELAQQGIAHQVIADNAAGHLMQRGEIDLVIVGSDRVLGRTGEIANKIGTYTKAVLAHRHRIPSTSPSR